MTTSTSSRDGAFSALSYELISHICSHAPQKDLLNLRAASRHLHSVATPWAFRRVKLGARTGQKDHEGFVTIAHSADLRRHVREVTVDTWVGPDFEYDMNSQYPFPQDLMDALPLLRCFRNLSSLVLIFNGHCGNDDNYEYIEESTDFRYRLLDIVFRCLAGTWSAVKQEEIDQTLDIDEFTPNYEVSRAPEGLQVDSPIPLRALTIQNLADYDDKRLTESESFVRVMTSGNLVDLKLHIAFQVDEWTPETDMGFTEKHDMLEDLHETWLSPGVARNLRVLSLYCDYYWGWTPRMDFRFVNPVEGGFPNLRVLALGRYVFSHDWQADWFASQGRMNPYGGLQELYLDDCPVMFHAEYWGPLDYGTTVVGQDAAGNDIVISNEGYPRSDVMTGDPVNMDYETHERPYSLRWHTILSHWREKMTALRVFKMGRGSWDGPPYGLIEMFRDEFPDEAFEAEWEDARIGPAFLNFAESPVPLENRGFWETNPERYKGWRGIHEQRLFELLYGQFMYGTIPGGWANVGRTYMEEEDDESVQPDKEADELQLELFRAVVEARAHTARY
ncbi:hypothetical protein ACJ41O_015311 [Fusarium nematophilum]